jgi:Carboxypeptidase regulatory-like domain
MIARALASLLAVTMPLQSPPPGPASRSAAATAVIRGHVLRSDGRPLSRAMVQIAGAEHRVRRMATTTADGVFEFTALLADEYTVAAQRPGYLHLEYGQRRPGDPGGRVAVADGETRDRIDLVLPRNGAIAGRVTDDRGDPVDGVLVRVLRVAYAMDRRALLDVPAARPRRSNDLGEYRIYGVPPGQYVVCAGLGPQPGTTGFSFAPACSPGAASPADAQFVSVDVAEDVPGIDFVVHRVRTVRVSGVARNAAGEPLSGRVTLGPPLETQPVAVPPLNAFPAADGSFAFAGVPPGDYVLQAFTSRPPQSGAGMPEGEFTARYITVGTRDVRDLSLVASRGSTVKGRFIFDGDADIGNVSITAFPTNLDLSPNTGGPPASAHPRADSRFELAGLTGPRRLTMISGSPPWWIKSITANGLDITDAVLSFGTADQSLENVDITVTTHAAEIAGTVMEASGQHANAATVLVYAADRGRWYRHSRYMGFARAQSDGSYRVSGLPAGEYFVAAVDRMEGTAGFGEWQDPAVLETLVPRATRIVLASAQQLALSLRLIVR